MVMEDGGLGQELQLASKAIYRGKAKLDNILVGRLSNSRRAEQSIHMQPWGAVKVHDKTFGDTNRMFIEPSSNI